MAGNKCICPEVPEFLDQIRERHEIGSDSQLAQRLDVTRATVSAWRKGHSVFDDTHALKVAELLDAHPCFVLACCHAQKEKANPDTYQAWCDVANSYKKLTNKKKGKA